MQTRTNPAEQPLPHDLGIERAVLGSLLTDNRRIEDLRDLTDRDFYNPIHSRAFSIIVKASEQGMPIDGATLRPLFAKERGLEIWDGVNGLSVDEYLTGLASYGVGRDMLRGYGQTLHHLATRRAMIGIAEDMLSAAYEAPSIEHPVSHIEDAEARLYRLKKQGVGAREVKSIHDAMQEALDEVESAYCRGTGLSGLSTGIAAADEVFGGLAPGGLYILAARPAMGKTALVANICMNIATAEEPTPVGMLSLEMTQADVGKRVLAERAKVPAWALRKGDVRDEQQWRDLFETVRRHEHVPFYIDESSGLTFQQTAMRARRMVSQYGLGLLVIDYLQLMRGSSKGQGNRVQELTEITTGLKALAKELQIPIIALSQLSRQVEQREDKRPQLSDLRESGSIEQDADCVGFIFREQYYLERSKPDPSNALETEKWAMRMGEAEGKAELIVQKNRHGPTGTALLSFDPDLISFS